MKLPYCVYVLLSLKDHNFYIGYSTNLDSRLQDHDNGKVSSTSARRPLELIYCEYHRNKYDALRRERYFKTTSGRKTLRLMLRESLKEVTNLKCEVYFGIFIYAKLAAKLLHYIQDYPHKPGSTKLIRPEALK